MDTKPGGCTTRAICCHCAARCGVLVDVDGDGRPLAVRGDPNHPVSQGFLCPRGRAAIESDESLRYQ